MKFKDDLIKSYKVIYKYLKRVDNRHKLYLKKKEVRKEVIMINYILGLEQSFLLGMVIMSLLLNYNISNVIIGSIVLIISIITNIVDYKINKIHKEEY